MTKPNPKRRVFAATMVLLFLAPTSQAVSATLGAVPSLSLSESWDSNIFNAPRDEESDFILRARPALDIYLSAFYTTLRFGGSVEIERFARHSELNSTSDTITRNLNLAVDKSKPLQITPLFAITPSVRYVETHDMVRRNQLTESPTPGLPPSETFVTSRVGVREYGGGVILSYALTPRLNGELGGGGYRREFIDSTPDLVDSKIYTLHAAVSRAMTPRFSSGIFFDAAENQFDNGGESRTYTAGLSGSYTLTEYYNLYVGLGATNTQERDVAGTSTEQKWSPYGSASLTYTWKRFLARLSVSYQVAGGGSFGTTTRRGAVYLGLSDRFAARWGWQLSGSYQKNTSLTDVSQASPNVLETASGTAGLSYAPARWLSMELNGNHFLQRTDYVSDLRRSAISLIVRAGTAIGTVIPQGISY